MSNIAASSRGSVAAKGAMIVVNRIACDGFGTCAELLPERITLDEWGYPIVDPAPMDARTLVHAKRAVTMCPRLALKLD